MARFSIGTAIGDAFALVRRRPLSTFVWGLLTVAPTFLVLGLMLPVMADVLAETGATGPSDAMIARMMQFQLVSMVGNLWQLLAMAVVYTAVFRAVLRPQESSAFSLRIGMDELRVAVVGLAIGVGVYAALLAAMMIGAAIGFAAWTAGGQTALITAVGVMVLILVVGLLFAMARVSLMAPASVLYRDFAFAQGWRMAAGNALPLMGMMVLIFLIIMLIEIVLAAAGVAVFLGVGATTGFSGAGLAADASPFAGTTDWLAAHWYWAALAGVMGAFLYGVLMTISIAPFASACRQLAESAPPAPAAGQSPAPAE